MNEYRLFALSALRTWLTNALGRRSPRFDSPRRVLVVKLDHLGDLLLATPALRALRESRPAVPIDAVVHPASAVLLDGGPLVDRVFRYESPRFRRGTTRASGVDLENRTKLLRALEGESYDWVVELRGDEWTAGPLLRALRPVRRFDRGTVRIHDGFSRRTGRLRGRRLAPPLHEIDTNLEIVRPALSRWPDTPAAEAPPWPHAALELERAAREIAPTFDPSRPFAVMQLGATWGPRAWRAERFGAVAAALRAAYDASIVVIGAAEDSPLRAAYESGGGPAESAYFFGSLPIPAIGALLRRATLFVGSDGGMAHLAAACGTPSLVLFGPQSPARFAPRGSEIIVLHRAVDCFPCAQVVCVKPENPCVNLTTIDEAVAAAKRLWEAAAPRPDSAGPRN